MKAVNNHLKKFALPCPIEVWKCVARLEQRDAARDVFTNANGLTIGGKIYLFRGGVTSMIDARDTLFHELFHRGLRRFLTRSRYITTMAEL